MQRPGAHLLQSLVGAGVVLIGLGLGFGALSIPSAIGYSGVGPNFLPWLVAIVLTLCGIAMVREAQTGGFRALEPPVGGVANWSAFVWVSAGLLSNAALITSIGFILSCTLCYVLAVQGLRRAAGQPAGQARVWATDVVSGALISAPVFWTFTQFLAVNLPGLTSTGWL